MIQSLPWNPDGKEIAFTGSDGSRGYATHIIVHKIAVDGGPVTNLTGKLDRGSSRRHYHDIRSMYAGGCEPIWDGDFIYFPVSDSNRHELHKVDPDNGNITPG